MRFLLWSTCWCLSLRRTLQIIPMTVSCFWRCLAPRFCKLIALSFIIVGSKLPIHTIKLFSGVEIVIGWSSAYLWYTIRNLRFSNWGYVGIKGAIILLPRRIYRISSRFLHLKSCILSPRSAYPQATMGSDKNWWDWLFDVDKTWSNLSYTDW